MSEQLNAMVKSLGNRIGVEKDDQRRDQLEAMRDKVNGYIEKSASSTPYARF